MNSQILVVLHAFGVGFGSGQQVTDPLVVDLAVTDPDSDRLVEFSAAHRVHLVDRTGQDTTVLEDGGAASHRVRLASTCLPVAEHSAVVAFDDRADDLVGSLLVHLVLAGVVQNILELELPAISLIVHGAVLRSLIRT